MSFSGLFEMFKDPSFGFNELITAVKELFFSVYNSDYILHIRSLVWGFFSHIERLVPLMLFATFVVIAFFGKRIYPVLRFILFFILGFGLGIYFLAPPILGLLPNLPTWVIGLAAGTVVSVLSKFLYYPVLALVVAAPVYVLCFSGGVPALSAALQGKAIPALVAAGVAVVLVLLVLKYFEMLLTALFGGWGVALVVKALFDYTAFGWLTGREWIAILGVTLLFAIPGFIVQVRTRRRY